MNPFCFLSSCNQIDFLVRCALGAIVLWPLIKLRKRIQEMLGQGTSNWFVFITVSQFHFLFYLSRPLPNTMALPLGKVLFYLRKTIEHSLTNGFYYLQCCLLITTGLASSTGSLSLVQRLVFSSFAANWPSFLA